MESDVDAERYQRRIALAMGLFFVGFVPLSFFVGDSAGGSVSGPLEAVMLALGALGVVAFVSAGFDADVDLAGFTLGWRQRFGLGFVLFGTVLALPGLVALPSVDGLGVSTLLGGVGFAAFGVLTFLEHDSLDGDDDPSMRQVATTLVAIMVLAIGGALAFIFLG